MYTISKKTHAVLIFITILTLYSCNYFAGKEDTDEKKSIKAKARVDTNKEQAKLLVDTSKAVIEVIDICEIAENLDPEKKKKNILKNLKEEQIKILNEIKSASASVMVSVPYNSNKSLIPFYENKQQLESSWHIINDKVVKQKKLVTKLKEKTSSKIILELTDTLIPIIDNNIALIEKFKTI